MGQTQVREFVQQSLHADSVEKIHGLCSAVSEGFGFDHFIYGARLPSSLVKPFRLAISGYPDEWRQRYSVRRYLAVDPTVAHCAHSVRPLVWEDLVREPVVDEQGRAFLQEAADFGLISGASLPLRGSHGEAGMLSFSVSLAPKESRRLIQDALPHLYLLSAYIHEAACRLASNGALPFQPQALTPRERECLLWSAEGKTSWEIALILGISERTVIFHLHNAGVKLKASTRQHAIARAISQGLITPQLD